MDASENSDASEQQSQDDFPGSLVAASQVDSGKLLGYEEKDTRRRIYLAVLEYMPLDFAALVERQSVLDKPLSFVLEVRAKVDSSEFEQYVVGTTVRACATVEDSRKSTLIMLRRGGWLPVGLCRQQDTLICD